MWEWPRLRRPRSRLHVAPLHRGEHGLDTGASATVALGPRVDELADDLRPLVPGYSPSDEPAVRLLSLAFARLERAEVALDEAKPGEAGKLRQDALRLGEQCEEAPERPRDDAARPFEARADARAGRVGRPSFARTARRGAIVRFSREALESPVAFADAIGVRLYDWQADVVARGLRREHGRFVHPIAGVSLPRGDGKTWMASFSGTWRFICGRAPQHVLSAALDYEGARLTVRYARDLLGELIDQGEVIERANGFQVPATGSVWEITSREHTASRGRHPDVVLYDELGWADDDLFESLLSLFRRRVEDPLFLVTSTVGPRQSGPLWELAQRAAGGDTDVYFEHSTENRNPSVTGEYLAPG